MHNRLVAGVDCSTQSTKVMVVDIDKGEIGKEPMILIFGKDPRDVIRKTSILTDY